MKQIAYHRKQLRKNTGDLKKGTWNQTWRNKKLKMHEMASDGPLDVKIWSADAGFEGESHGNCENSK